jgi:hypothetical protein
MEVPGELVEACCDAAELLDTAEEALDEVSLSIDVWIDGTPDDASRAAWDVGAGTGSSDEVEDGVAVVASVSDDCQRRGKAGEQTWNGGHVGSLTGREQQPDRQSLFVDNGMDLGAQSSTRTANGVIRTPFLPPAACWWARTIELSMNCKDCGERAASVSKIRSHTPALAQRL